MCVMCVLLIYAISISILCVSQEGLSLAESNQEIDFYTRVIFENQRYFGPL